jgi:hypothetical protein
VLAAGRAMLSTLHGGRFPKRHEDTWCVVRRKG